MYRIIFLSDCNRWTLRLALHERTCPRIFHFGLWIVFPCHGACFGAGGHSMTISWGFLGIFHCNFLEILCILDHWARLSSTAPHKTRFHSDWWCLNHADSFVQNCPHTRIHYHKAIFHDPSVVHFSFPLSTWPISSCNLPKPETLAKQS